MHIKMKPKKLTRGDADENAVHAKNATKQAPIIAPSADARLKMYDGEFVSITMLAFTVPSVVRFAFGAKAKFVFDGVERAE